MDILKGALRIGGIIAVGETIDAAAAQDGLAALNMMLTSQPWQGLAVVATTKENFPLVAGQTSYTMGASGNFNTVCPTQIVSQFLRDSASADYPVTLIDEDRYNALGDKTLQGRPEYLYVSYAYPLATLYFYYVPDAAYTFYVNSEKPLAEMTSLTQVFSLPPAYLSAIKWNLFLELAPEYQKDPTAFQYKQAERYLSAVKNINAANRVPVATLNTPWSNLKSQFNINNPDADY